MPEAKAEGTMTLDKLRFAMIGRKDKTPPPDGPCDYYFTTTNLPAMLDLRNTVFHVFPWENDDGSFGADLVIRQYDPNHRAKQDQQRNLGPNKRRRSFNRPQAGKTEGEENKDE